MTNAPQPAATLYRRGEAHLLLLRTLGGRAGREGADSSPGFEVGDYRAARKGSQKRLAIVVAARAIRPPTAGEGHQPAGGPCSGLGGARTNRSLGCCCCSPPRWLQRARPARPAAAAPASPRRESLRRSSSSSATAPFFFAFFFSSSPQPGRGQPE